MQDVLTPYHLKPIPEWYWVGRLFRLREVFNTICSQHMYFEGYTGYHLWHGSESYVQCIEGCKPQALSDFRRDLAKASRAVRRLFYSIFRECRLFWGEGESEFPMPLQGEWIEKHTPPEQLNNHVCKWLYILSTFIKGYIKMHVLPHMQGDAA